MMIREVNFEIPIERLLAWYLGASDLPRMKLRYVWVLRFTNLLTSRSIEFVLL